MMPVASASKSFRWLFILLIVGTAGLAIAFLIGNVTANGGVLGVPLDDAWIHLQFARNLRQGAGFSFNAGVPTPGSTAPLWTLLLALTHGGAAPLAAPVALSLLFFVAVVGLTVGLGRQLGLPDGYALLAGAAVALTGRLLWASLSGMEVTAFTALTLAALWLYAARGPVWPLFVLLGLAAQLRPEGHLLFLLLMADLLLARVRRQPEAAAWRALILGGLIYGLINLPYAAFSLATTGRPLPNTFYVKSNHETLYSWKTLTTTLAQHWSDNPVAGLLLLAGLYPLWRRGRPVLAWLLGLLLVMPLIVAAVWHHGRYTMPVIPLQMLTAAAGLHWLLPRLKTGPPRAVQLAAPLLALLFLAGGAAGLPTWEALLRQNTREIAAIDVAAGRWLAANTPPDAVIAVDDIGAIGYLSERRIFDLQGLVSPAIWPALGAADQVPRTVQIMSDAGVSHLVIFPKWHPFLVDSAAMVEQARLATYSRTIILDTQVVLGAFADPYGAPPAGPAIATWADALALTGAGSAGGGETARLALQWRCLAPPGRDWKVFVHVVDNAGNIVAQADHVPGSQLAPTGVWRAGDVITYEVTLALPAGTPTADLQLVLGLYDESDFSRPLIAGAARPVVYDGAGLVLGAWPAD